MKHSRRIEVEWTDSSSPDRDRWLDLNDYDPSPTHNSTCGYLMRETKHYVVIASSICDQRLVAGLITIPKFAITKRTWR